MSIRIKLRKNEIKSNKNYGQYFAETVSMGTVGVEQLAEEISRNCTLKSSDVQGAIIALQEVMANHLQSGETVVLPGIGSFSLSAESSGAESPKKFSLQRHIRGIRTALSSMTWWAMPRWIGYLFIKRDGRMNKAEKEESENSHHDEKDRIDIGCRADEWSSNRPD